MNTPNFTPDTSDDTGSRKRPDRTQRAAFWLRAIEQRKHTMTREYRRSLRDVAREGISDEEYAAMLGTLEKMARNLGWDESQADEQPFGRGHGRGFGRGRRHPAMMHGFGRGHARLDRHARHHDGDHHGHDEHHGHNHGHNHVHGAGHDESSPTGTPQA